MPSVDTIIPFTQGLSKGISTYSDNVEMVNMYLVPTPGGRSPTQMVPTFGGTVLNTAIPSAGNGCRGAFISSTGPESVGFVATPYMVFGNTLYRLNRDNSLIFVGTVSNAISDVSFTENQDQTFTRTRAFICDGTTVYEWDIKAEDDVVSSTFVEVAQLPLVNGTPDQRAIASYITYNGYRLILTCANSVQWFFSGQNESNFGNSRFEASESNPDKTVRAISHGGNVWVFSSYSYDIFAPTFFEGDPYDVPTNGSGKIGAVSGDSITTHGDYLFWCGQGDTANNAIYMADIGGSISRISSSGIEEILREWKYKPFIKGFAFSDRGLTFYAITSLQDRETLVYCLETKLWHKRSTSNDGRESYWAVRNVLNVYDKVIYVTHDSNQVCQVNYDNCIDHNGWQIPRYYTAPVVIANLDLFKLKQLTIDVECGTSLDPVTEPQMWIQLGWNGRTPTEERKMRGLGVAGRYTKTVTVLAAGAGRGLVVRFGTSASIPVVFYQMRLVVEKAGRS